MNNQPIHVATINKGATQRQLAQGDKGTYAGFPATIVRHYSGNMYEIRMPGGVGCMDAYYFLQAEVGR